MKNEVSGIIKYGAVLYYEWHPIKKDVYAIHVRFPDLAAINLPASTVGNEREDAIAMGKEILEIMVEYAVEESIPLPSATPLEKLNIDREFDDIADPFRIEILEISLD